MPAAGKILVGPKKAFFTLLPGDRQITGNPKKCDTTAKSTSFARSRFIMARKAALAFSEFTWSCRRLFLEESKCGRIRPKEVQIGRPK